MQLNNNKNILCFTFFIIRIRYRKVNFYYLLTLRTRETFTKNDAFDEINFEFFKSRIIYIFLFSQNCFFFQNCKYCFDINLRIRFLQFVKL